jgi:hypothetical protein
LGESGKAMPKEKPEGEDHWENEMPDFGSTTALKAAKTLKEWKRKTSNNRICMFSNMP